jgi:O-methyltransferase
MSTFGRLAGRLRPRRSTPAPTGPPSIADTLSEEERAIVDRCRPYSLATSDRIVATMDAVEYAARRGVEGAFVECGVWRGGSVLAMILTLRRIGADDRDIFLFDTFSGMTEPSAFDTSRFDQPAHKTWRDAVKAGRRAWDALFREEAFGQEHVEELLVGAGYPRERLHFVVGPVEETLPSKAPDAISLLRLDTDWYESTRHELEHLYPKIVRSGVLIVDDYGHWDGARLAVDEYFTRQASPLLFARSDYTGRIAVKV